MAERAELIQPPLSPTTRTRGQHVPILTLVGGGMVLVWILIAIFADFLAPYDPRATNMGASLRPMSPEHWLGTDLLGRDILSQIIHGTRINLSMGIIGVIAPFLIGITIGTTAGYFGGLVDTLLMRLLDIALAFPFIVLVLAIVSVLGPGLINYYIALAIVAWVPYARLVRAEVLVLRKAEFIEAARVLGYEPLYIIARHILPNAVSPAIVFVMTDIVLTILLGSGLGFFGLGAEPSIPEWGRMIRDGQTFMGTAWWITVFPGVAIVFLALSFSLLGDGLSKQLRVRS